jgi:hypothetical protein
MLDRSSSCSFPQPIRAGCGWHVYKFGTLRLGAGKQAIIHTGKGTSYITSTSRHLYWGRSWYVWNNTGDKVILRRADGSLKGIGLAPCPRRDAIAVRLASVRLVKQPEQVSSVRQAAAVCNVSPSVVRRRQD